MAETVRPRALLRIVTREADGSLHRHPERPVPLGMTLAEAAGLQIEALGLALRPARHLPPEDRIERATDGTLLRHEVVLAMLCETDLEGGAAPPPGAGAT